MLPTKRPEIWTCLSQHSWWFKCSGVWVGLSKIPSLNDFSLRPLRLPQGLNCLNKPKLCSVPWGPQHLSSLGKNSKCTYTSVLATGVSSSWFLYSNLCHDVQSFPSSEGQRGGTKSAANPDYQLLASEMMSNNLLCLLVVIPTFSRKAGEFFGSCYALQFQRLAAFCRLLWDRAVHWTFQSVRGCTSPSSIPQQKANMRGSQRANNPDR